MGQRPLQSKLTGRPHPLCTHCPKKDQCSVVDIVKDTSPHATDVVLTRYSAGAAILIPHREVVGLHTVCEGLVAVSCSNESGRDTVCRLTGVADCLDLRDNVLGCSGHSVTARALTTCIVAFIRHDRLRKAIDEDGALAQRLLRYACGELQDMVERFDRHVSYSVQSRVLYLFLRFAEMFGKSSSRQVTAPIQLKRDTIAALAGATPETISWTLTKLKHSKLVEFSETRITIPDVERLRTALRRHRWR